ncbi:hypothetical protein HPB51_001150 [Rhipicephalus microplus]|uniref:Uncharacterized protein n=1 Tax=Rhipicephalus microplus TaxID=6941 RepID=A0A9J6DS93_RHIMP|nr:hypothetical protein HPB51_001150 [Rhipicephalus microplus]
MLYEWLNDLPERLRRSATQLPTTTKAISMFDVCMNQVDSTADVVLSFLRDRGLAWQNMLPKSQEFPNQLWLLFAPNDLISQWAPFLNDIREELYVRYWTLFHSQLISGNAMPSTNAAINESFYVQRFVFDTLLRAAANTNKKPTMLPLKTLADYPELSSAGFVVDVMNRTLGLAQQLPDDEAQLLISDEVYLDAVREIVRRLSVSELKRHLAWLFVQTHGVVADPGRLLFALFGEKSRARQERPLFCASQTEPSYKLLVAAADSVTRFTVKERRVISDRLADVVKARFQDYKTPPICACEDLFPDVPAVEVAFAAFLDGFSGDSDGLRLSPRFSEPQVFFLTLCYLTCTCSSQDNIYGADCN